MNNRIAKALKWTAKCIWLLGAVAVLYFGFNTRRGDATFDFLIAVPVGAGSFLMGLFTTAIGEIICILHDIRAKTFLPSEITGSDIPKPAMYVEDMAASDASPTATESSLEQLESFIWICTACGEINLSSSNTCRICKAAKP